METEPSLDERVELCTSMMEEIIQPEELRQLLSRKKEPICYDGFEPSGRMHIAQGVMKALIVNRMTRAGCRFVFWVADWFALMNNKLGGDLKKIQTVGKYMIEVWSALGMDLDKVEFRWASEHINSNANDYWLRVLDIARTFNIPRVKRCSQIMGRDEDDDLSTAQLMYPCMQCADVFYLKADICQLGLDQRKVNMLARDYCDAKKIKVKPVILSHHMLMGLKEGQQKMSKSEPDSAIFMEDSEVDVNTKIRKAYCPPGVVEGNPILDYCKWVILPAFDRLDVGECSYTTYTDLEADYTTGRLHPSDLKPAVAKAINLLIEPVRRHFETNKEAATLRDTVRGYKINK